MNKWIYAFLLSSFLLSQGCIFSSNKVKVNVQKKAEVARSVHSVSLINNQLIINGKGLDKITSLKIKNDQTTANFTVVSADATKIIANAANAVAIGVGQAFELVISGAEGASTFAVTFTLENGSITAAHLSPMGASVGQVLKYNGSAWVPSTLTASQLYMGTWNAYTNSPDLTATTPQSGDYYIISTGGTFDLGTGSVTYDAGDMVIYNGTTWEKISNSAMTVTSFKGRNGIVTPAANDYTWAQIDKSASKLENIADIDVAGRVDGQVLKWSAGSSKWVVSNDEEGSGTPTAGSVTNNEISGTANIAQSKIANLTSDLASKQPLITAAATTTYYRGDKTFVTLDTSVVPENSNLYFNNARALGATLTGFSVGTNSSVAATDSILGAFQKVQAQLNAKVSDVGGTSLTGLSTTTNAAISASDTVLSGMGKLQKQITDLDSAKLNKTGGTLSVGTINGVPAPVNADDIVNKAYVDALTGRWSAGSGGHAADLYFNTGSIGIGLATPQTKLDVAGAVRIGYDATSCSSMIEGAFRFNSTTKLFEKCNGTVWSSHDGLSAIPASTSLVMSACPASWTDVGPFRSGPTTLGRVCESPASLSLLPASSSLIMETCPVGWTRTGTAGTVVIALARNSAPYSICESPAANIPLPSGTRLVTLSSCPSPWIDLNTTLKVGPTTPTCNALTCKSCEIPGQFIGVSSLHGGNGGTTGQGGPITIVAGVGGTTSGNGGGISVIAGNATDGNGGGIVITAGSASTTTATIRHGGGISMASGQGVANGNGGNISITSAMGNGTGTNGYILLNPTTGHHVGVGTASPQVLLDVNGPIRIGTSSATCSSTIAGSMRFNTPNVEYCDGTNWTAFSTGGGSGGAVVSSDITDGTIVDADINASAAIAQSKIANLTTDLAAKEPAITAGTTSQYLKGDKSLGTFVADVLASALTGLSTATNAVITATDTVLSGMGKLQKQITDLGTSKLNTTGGTLSVGTISGVPTPTNADDVANKGYVDTFGKWSKDANGVYYDSNNVGIGDTPSGSARLYVDGETRTTRSEGDDVFRWAMGINRQRSGSTAPASGFGAGIGWYLEGFSNYSTVGAGEIGVFWENNQTNNTTDRDTSMSFSVLKNDSLVESMRLTSDGKVGVGTNAPRAALEVNGAIVSKPATNNSTSTVNFLTGNIQYTTANCGAYQLDNMKDGATYTFIVQGATSAICSFTAYSGEGTGALTVHLPTDHGSTAANKHTVYTFLVAGTHVYTTWMYGY